MACDIVINLAAESREKARKGMADLAKRLKEGSAQIVIDKRTGALAFRGWRSSDIGMSDACVFRRMVNDPLHGGEIRRAVAAAERASGRKLDPKAIAAGVHSHDGGATWGSH